MLGRCQKSGRQTKECGEQWTHSWSTALVGLWHPLFDKPTHVVRVQAPSVPLLHDARLRKGHVGVRICEEQTTRGLVHCLQLNRRKYCESTASAITSQRNSTIHICAKVRQVPLQPERGRNSVVHRCWCRILGCKAVVHGEHRRIGRPSQPAANCVMGVKITHHETATVKVEDGRLWVGSGSIQPGPEPVVSGQVSDLKKLWATGTQLPTCPTRRAEQLCSCFAIRWTRLASDA